jgi:hypothetical protein
MVRGARFAYRTEESQEGTMDRYDFPQACSDRGLWWAFVSAVVAGGVVAFFIAP